MAAGGTLSELASAGEGVLRISVDELGSHLETLESELSGGKLIELVRGEVVVAEMRAPHAAAQPSVTSPTRSFPDFMAQMQEVFGGRVFPAGTTTKWIEEDREDRALLS